MNRLLLLSTALSATLALPLQAQQVFDLDEITFSANRAQTELRRTGATVTVVTEDDLKDAGDVQLADYLKRLPGITVTQNGPPGTSMSLRVRGLDGRYVPVFINGIDMTDPAELQSQFSFSGLTLDGISRIEILRGSQSALYGSSAIGGVINITTIQAPEENGTIVETKAEYGSYNTLKAYLGVASRFDRGEVAFTLTRNSTDGFSAAEAADGNTEADGHRSLNLTFTGSYDVTDALKLGVSAFYQDAYGEFDAGGGVGGDDPDRYGTSNRFGAQVYAEFAALGADHRLSLEYSQTERADPTAPAWFSTTHFRGDRTALRYLGKVDLGGDSKLSFGLDHVIEGYQAWRPAGATFTGSINTTAAHAELAYAINPALDLSLAARYDHHSRFGGAATGRAALSWRASESTVLRASAGTGFRAPSLNEMYGPFGANPDLQPEHSRSFELGASHVSGKFSLDGTLFYTEIDNLIEYTTAYNQVPGTSVNQGVELSARYEFSDRFALGANYTYTDARDRNGNRRLRVPAHTLGVVAETRITDRLRNVTTLTAVEDRLESGGWGNPPITMPGYTVVNTSFTYGLTDKADLIFRVENLFNTQYQTVRGFGTSDRAFYVGLAARF